MSRYLFHGSPCTRCLEEPEVGRPVQRATHYSLCARHWMGATETQRRAAIFDDETIIDADEALRRWAA